MGAWGIHYDECDGALDFFHTVEESRDWGMVDGQIRGYIGPDGDDDAEQTLAALELVAAALGHASPRLGVNLREWAVQHAGQAEALRNDAGVAAATVLDHSELSELWAEADEGDDWRATIVDLQARLQA